MTEPTHIRKAIREGALAELFASASHAHRAGVSTVHPDRIADILRTPPEAVTFSGETCWRHRKVPVVHPYDECPGCIEERHAANEHREAAGRPIQMPHVQGIYQPQLTEETS